MSPPDTRRSGVATRDRAAGLVGIVHSNDSARLETAEAAADPSLLPAITDLARALAEQSAVLHRLRDDVSHLADQVAGWSVAGRGGGTEERDARLAGLAQLHRVVRQVLPAGARIAVVADGDADVADVLGSHVALPLPSPGGERRMPTSDRAAVLQLESLRWLGAEFLVLPGTGQAWQDRFPGFRRSCERFRLVAQTSDATVWSLDEPGPLRPLDELVLDCLTVLPRQPVVLDLTSAADLSDRYPTCRVFTPLDARSTSSYVEDSADVVVVDSTEPGRLREAERLASRAVVLLPDEPGLSTAITWSDPAWLSATAAVSVIVVPRSGRELSSRHQALLAESMGSSFAGQHILVNPDESGGLAGAIQQATGDVVVVVAGTTWPLTGWLPAMLRTFHDHPSAAVVTGRLVTTDARLVHAGERRREARLEVLRPGDGDVDAPQFSHVRRVDASNDRFFGIRRANLQDLESLASQYVLSPRALTGLARGDVIYQPECAAFVGDAELSTDGSGDGGRRS